MEHVTMESNVVSGMKAAYNTIQDYAKQRRSSLIFLANSTEPEFPEFAAKLRERAVAMEEVVDAIDNILSII